MLGNSEKLSLLPILSLFTISAKISITGKTQIIPLYFSYQHIIDLAIKMALKGRKIKKSNSITLQDNFYCKISQIEDIIKGLQSIQDDAFNKESPKDIVDQVMTINNIILVCIVHVSFPNSDRL